MNGATESSNRRQPIQVTLNGEPLELDVDPVTRVVDVLRAELGLTGTKEGCGVGECGACTVLVDDRPRLSCLLLIGELAGRSLITIEASHDARIERVRRAFLDEGALQCGLCTPGLILAASRIPAGVDEDAIRAALAGNLCRCTGYASIVRAVQRAQTPDGSGH